MKSNGIEKEKEINREREFLFSSPEYAMQATLQRRPYHNKTTGIVKVS